MARTATYNRDDALNAAMSLFWAKGYHATSLKDLENALQMRPGSIYAAFHSKEALFREALDAYADRMAGELQALIQSSPTPLAALQAHLTGLADITLCDKPSTACMLVKSLLEMSDNSDLRSVILTHLDNVEVALTEAIASAVQTGEIPAHVDPTRQARRLQTYIFGLKIQAQRETDPEKMQQLCEDLAQEIGGLARLPQVRI